MEQEFSMSGLVLSLSIAFFIAIGSAEALSMTYQSMTAQKVNHQQEVKKIYNNVLVENYDQQNKFLA